MQPTPPYAVNHPAIPLLHSYATAGCPVDCGPDWTMHHILLLLKRGPHPSAQSRPAVIQLREETVDKVKHGYARVVRWKDIKHDMPKNLKLSPVAMIPHKSKPFRCILDLSFKLKHKGKCYPSVNENTNPMSKQQSMAQLGSVLKRIICQMARHYDPNHPFQFAKLDIKDGFWRMAVSDTDAWNFCYVLPTLDKNITLDDVEIVVPNSLQMGWCESPPFFCSGSETARDIIATIHHQDLPPHYLEGHMLEGCDAAAGNDPVNPLTLIEVYVDDFIGVTNDIQFTALKHLSRAMLHGIHSIFPPPAITKHCRHDPVSLAKLRKGEGRWSTQKDILGWILDGLNCTIQLPQEKSTAIARLLRKTLKKQRVSIRKFQQLVGKLQHASFGIPGGRSLFTPFDMAMHTTMDYVEVNPVLRSALQDWRYLVHAVAQKPTSIFQLISRPPAYIGHSDACRLGAGGGVVRRHQRAPTSPMASPLATGYHICPHHLYKSQRHPLHQRPQTRGLAPWATGTGIGAYLTTILPPGGIL